MSRLVLSRARGEALKIGDEICVTVLGARGQHVRLAVDAPRHVRIDRVRGQLEAPPPAPEDELSPLMRKALARWE